MKRKAVLIESSNVKGCTDLPGARIDIDNWTVFLRSDHGGAWAASEVVVLRKPFSSDVKAALDVSKDCYCFVAFSGHGSDGSVVLNDHLDSFPVSDLKPKGEKGTLIVDSCRGVGGARRYAFSKMESFANQSRDRIVALNASRGESMAIYESREWMPKVGRTANAAIDYWIAALKDAPAGTVQMLSCSRGQAAGEDPNSGGYYTSLLMQSADVWTKNNTTENVHTTRDAHDYASLRLPPQQTPEYSPSWLRFPFAAKS